MFDSIQSALAWAVLHFLWQGAVIGVVAAGALGLVRRENAAARYSLGLGALVISLIAFVATFGMTLTAPAAELGPRVALPASVDLEAPEYAAASAILAELTEVAPEGQAGASGAWAWLWAAGALLMGLRLVRGCCAAQRLQTRSLTSVDATWQGTLDALCVDLGIRRAVRMLKSELVDSPAVVGWLTPLILVPATTFTALTPEQLRAVLAHELAHIRRYDHLANALQALIEVLLFFHPVVWWLSRLVREEREHCCDFVAVQSAGSPLLLAQALTRLESLRLTNQSVALAARTHGGSLMNRISRILDTRNGRPQRPLGWRLLTSLSAGALVLGLGVAQAAPEAPAEPGGQAPRQYSDRSASDDYALIEERILVAVKAGELSVGDAKRTLSALRRTMFKQGGRAQVRERNDRSVFLGQSDRKRLTELRRRLSDESRARDTVRVDRETRAALKLHYRDAEKKIKAATKSGSLSVEDAKAKLEGLRRSIELKAKKLKALEAKAEKERQR